MSDEDKRSEEEWKRYKRIRDLNAERQESPLPRRRHPAGTQPFPTATSPTVRHRAPPLESHSFESFPQYVEQEPEPTTSSRPVTPPPQRVQQGPNLSVFSPPSASTEPFGVTDPFRFTFGSPLDPFSPGTSDPWANSQRETEGLGDLSQGFSDLDVSEPSVRPKVRPTAPRPAPPPYRPVIPPYARQRPIPEPPIVEKYSDPLTGEPSLDRLRQLPRGARRPTTSREMGAYLSNISRDQISHGILAHDSERPKRKKQLLTSRGFEPIDEKVGTRTVQRYYPQARPLPKQRPYFAAQTERDRDAIHMPRFNRPLKEMDKRQRRTWERESIVPIGRQQWGPQPLRRAYSLPDFSDPNLVSDMEEPERATHFRDRFIRLPTADRESYRQFQSQVSWANHPQARSRMIKPPTIGNIRDSDHRRLAEIKRFRQHMMKFRVTPQTPASELRNVRRTYVRESAYPDPSFTQELRGRERASFPEWMAQAVRQEIPERYRRIDEEDEDIEEE